MDQLQLPIEDEDRKIILCPGEEFSVSCFRIFIWQKALKPT